MFVYQADTYCNACGRDIAARLTTEGLAPTDPDDERTYDSDEFPKGGYPAEETDGPDHCAGDSDCLGDAVDLGDWGLVPDAELYGAESRVIGELLSSGLTEYGVSYLREMLDDSELTPYQVALYEFWRAAFVDELHGA